MKVEKREMRSEEPKLLKSDIINEEIENLGLYNDYPHDWTMVNSQGHRFLGVHVTHIKDDLSLDRVWKYIGEILLYAYLDELDFSRLDSGMYDLFQIFSYTPYLYIVTTTLPSITTLKRIKFKDLPVEYQMMFKGYKTEEIKDAGNWISPKGEEE